ncbi:MAG: hypothetical protein K2M70_12750 [Lachnospiraceae bacterium]|nr:hypothetical protein [Lachnospiraceae bacterium]
MIINERGEDRMKRVTKLVSLALVGAMVFSTPVMAKEVGAPVAVYLEEPSDIGVPAITVRAIDEDKLVHEYMANAVTGIWDMDSVIPVAQGGDVILDGQKSNVTFPVLKPELSRVYSAKDLAASLGGSVLNVIKTETHVGFGVANVNYYMPGITGAENIHVYTYNESTNTWVEVTVTEKRADHVVVNLTGTGVLAFIVTP